MENWKPIAFTNGDYLVSDMGRVKTAKTGRILAPAVSEAGYERVGLFKCDREKRYRVHRLVAEVFIPNPDNLPQVNHKDGNKRNNCVSNLEWVTAKENMVHAHITGLADNQRKWCESKRKAIVATKIDTGESTYFDSITAAKKVIRSNHIQDVLNGVRGMAKGYTFRYANGGDTQCQH